MLEDQRCHTVIPDISFSLLLSSKGVGVARAKVVLRFQKELGTSCLARFLFWYLVAAAPVSPLGSLAGFVYRCFQMKHLFVFQLLADKCRAFIASDIKVLGIYFESEAKNICIGIFLNLFF